VRFADGLAGSSSTTSSGDTGYERLDSSDSSSDSLMALSMRGGADKC
jgi:hypothetical protein